MRVAHEERRGYDPKDGTKQNIIREIMLYLEEKLLWRSPATINDVLKGVFRKASLPVDQILSTELRKVLSNLKRFFEKTNKQRGTQTILLRDSVRSILSGPSIDPQELRNLLCGTSLKVSQFYDAQVRRSKFDESGDINALRKVNVYLKKSRFPLKVKCQIIN